MLAGAVKMMLEAAVMAIVKVALWVPPPEEVKTVVKEALPVAAVAEAATVKEQLLAALWVTVSLESTPEGTPQVKVLLPSVA